MAATTAKSASVVGRQACNGFYMTPEPEAIRVNEENIAPFSMPREVLSYVPPPDLAVYKFKNGDTERKIHCNTELTKQELEQLAQMQKEAIRLNREFYPSVSVMATRYISRARGDVKKALQLMCDTQEWRSKYFRDGPIVDSSLLDDLKLGIVYFVGRDKELRPTIVCRADRVPAEWYKTKQTDRLIRRNRPRRAAFAAIVGLLVYSFGSAPRWLVHRTALVAGAGIGLFGRRRASTTALPCGGEPTFMVDISDFTPEKRKHLGPAGGEPEVESVRTGEHGVFAARGTVRLSVPAKTVFDWLTDPEENTRIFSSNVAALNYRKFLGAGSKAGTRLFEVSKTGKWRLLGIPLTFESTVVALEDWPKLEIRYGLKKPGAMRHMAGFWRTYPVTRRETLVYFYTEAIPSFPMPGIFKRFAGRVCEDMAASLLGDLRAEATAFEAKATSRHYVDVPE